MKLTLMVLGLSALLFNPIYAIAADERSTAAIEDASEEKSGKFCPVCGPEEGMAGKDDLSFEYEGKTYYFCSEDCLNAFKADPEKFMKHDHKDNDPADEESHEGHDHGEEAQEGHDHDKENHEGHDHK